jgi:hypothetical protein
MKIKISGACQTAGILEAIRILLPKYYVSVLTVQQASNESLLYSEILDSDILLTAKDDDENLFKKINPNALILRWPQIYFPAFHPDIAVATSQGHTIQSMEGCPYNSTICLWSYINNLPIKIACELFSTEVFQNLGYIDCWNNSTINLAQDFKRCDLNFDKFFNSVKRSGVFMHTDSHAKAYPIIQIAKQLAQKIEGVHLNVDIPIERYLNDTLLFDSIWPIYPGISDALGVQGSYIWKYRNNFYHGLEEYVSNSYLGYDSQKFYRQNVNCGKINQITNEILSNFARKLT